MRLIPKNWESFQHYKDRAPPWIKLHKSLLDDRTFQRLPDASRALAPCLWLLASESKDGSFDASTDELEFRVRQTPKWIEVALKPLILNGFFSVVHDASTVLADCKQDAPLEEERRGEAETEKSSAKTEKPTRFMEFWSIYPNKQDKGKCSAKWVAEGLDTVADIILKDVKAKKNSKKWVDGYAELSTTYLNNKRWEDSQGPVFVQSQDESWFSIAGFDAEGEARNFGCTPSNAHLFQNGQRAEVVA